LRLCTPTFEVMYTDKLNTSNIKLELFTKTEGWQHTVTTIITSYRVPNRNKNSLLQDIKWSEHMKRLQEKKGNDRPTLTSDTHCLYCCLITLCRRLNIKDVCLRSDSPPGGHGLLLHEVSRSHTTTHRSRQDSSGRVISSSQRPLPDNTQHSQKTYVHAHGGIWTHNLSRRAAANLHLRPPSHWDWQSLKITALKSHYPQPVQKKSIPQNYYICFYPPYSNRVVQKPVVAVCCQQWCFVTTLVFDCTVAWSTLVSSKF